MIESDGYIYVPKHSQNEGGAKYSYPYIMITFHTKDLPLFNRLMQILGTGHITEVKGANAYRFYVKGIKNLMNLIELLNGKFRTPKIITFHNLIN